MTAALTLSDATPASEVRQQTGATPPAPVCISLPVPPSLNNAFANVPGKGRIKSKAYTRWIDEAAVEFRAQSPDAVPGRVIVSVCFERDNLQADVDNRVKPLLDFLVQPGRTKKARVDGVIADDKLITAHLVCWSPRSTAHTARARIAIWPVGPLTARFHPSPDGATGGWFTDAPSEEEYP